MEALPADSSIRTSLGHSCPASPCVVKVARKTPFTAFAERPGYHPTSIEIKTKVAMDGGAAFAGNVLIGGAIGMGVDAVSGATLDHYPNPAVLVLQPLDPSNPQTPVQVAPPPRPHKNSMAVKPAAPEKPSPKPVS